MSPGQLQAITSKLERVIVPRRRSVTSPRHMVGTQDMDSEEEEDLSRVEEEMMTLFRKITGPMRRARQRKYSADKIESEIEKIKYAFTHCNDVENVLRIQSWP